MGLIKIKNALISVYNKDRLYTLASNLEKFGIQIFSTGGTAKFLAENNFEVVQIEDITHFPEILEGRVKTLHPAVFGGILAKRNDQDLKQLIELNFSEFDLVIVDLYPFAETVKNNQSHEDIIEKIDIGGISLIRAASKNYQYVTLISSIDQYESFIEKLNESQNNIDLAYRLILSKQGFKTSFEYDNEIFKYFTSIEASNDNSMSLRYGENPHQHAFFDGNISKYLDKKSGKDLSYNNLVDVDSAIQLISEFKKNSPTFAIIKHTNLCGIASDPNLMNAWKKALSSDPVSAFGGVFITNNHLDIDTAEEIHKLFFEIIIAPSYDISAIDLLSQKKNRIILELKSYPIFEKMSKSILGGKLSQDYDNMIAEEEELRIVTNNNDAKVRKEDLFFAIKCYRHLKSNAIVIVKNNQLIGSGVGQTSRIDAMEQAVKKAITNGFDMDDSYLGSDAFLPFADVAQIAKEYGISWIVQPGGSMNDQKTIDFCNNNDMQMVFTGKRHFKH